MGRSHRTRQETSKQDSQNTISIAQGCVYRIGRIITENCWEPYRISLQTLLLYGVYAVSLENIRTVNEVYRIALVKHTICLILHADDTECRMFLY